MNIFSHISVTICPINTKQNAKRSGDDIFSCCCCYADVRGFRGYTLVDLLICQHGAEGISNNGILILASSTSSLHVEPL